MHTGELLALKVMTSHLGGSEDAVARFKREALVVSKIRSEHVVRIFDADVASELGGAPFLVMDLLEGIDLEELSDEKAVDGPTVVEWLRQVAKPLDKAHRLQIIHRDLKPANLFLTRKEDGTSLIKILDFGIARIASESMSVGSTQTGQLFGTPLYMAPEQARGEPSRIGPATDLYTLALTAFKLLTGVSYRRANTLDEMLEDILRSPLRAPSELGYDLGPEFDCWFLRACHADPAHRFKSAATQVEALARAFGLPVLEDVALSSSNPSRLGSNVVAGLEIPVNSLTPVVERTHPPATAKTDSTLTLRASRKEDEANRRRSGWRSAFFVSLALSLFAFAILLSTRPGNRGAPAAAATAVCPAPESAVASAVAIEAPRVANAATAEPPSGLLTLTTAAPEISPKAAGASAVNSAATAARGRSSSRASAAPTPAPVHATPPRPRPWGSDDPLGDQQ
jgi:serine/threonine-protein kinase